ncbi:MAG: alanine racemase [Glaciihabitans sp.]|nr:alanine racemase [Glaciihabitans sp.]
MTSRVLIATELPLATRTVDLSAIARNVRRVLAIGGTPIMAVVKADAFGHGAVEVARATLAAGASWLGVATVAEALELRRNGLDAPILAWLIDPWVDLEDAVRQRVTLSCANAETLAAVTSAARVVDATARVHLELDTGMARGGSTVDDWGDLCERAAAAETAGAVVADGVWSHLALASRVDEQGVERSLAAFDHGVGVALAAGLNPKHVHLANSAGALAHPSTRLSMVRVGAALYGIETVRGRSFGLEPAMRVVSHVAQLRRVEAGTGIGYLHEFVTSAPTTLALVPVGYADGIPRALSRGGEVSIGGRRRPIRGAISMDQLVVEVNANDVRLGDEVVLLGDPRVGEPDSAEWARIADTVPHDVLCGFGERVVRRHSELRPSGGVA